MAEETFVRKTLDKLLEVVEVEFKIPLGIAEVKFSATEVAKNWWENKKSRLEVEAAIRRAEEKFIAAHPDNRLAQILHGFPLYSDEEYRNVILELLKHLDEERITWLAEIKIENEWNRQINRQDIRKALELYIPYLRHELNGIREFREIITARMLERIEENTIETVQGVRRIESKLDRVLDSRTREEEPDYWYIPHPYPMPPNFTGRAAELQMLDDWLANDKDRLFILRALGGFGKSALTWQWVNTRVNPAEWTKLVWWSFYEGDASFENFVKSSLDYLNLDAPQGQRPQVDELLKALQRDKILLIMDGFERALRAYSGMNAVYDGDEEVRVEDNQLDCVNINAEWFLRGVCSLPFLKSKVLMTTRLTPRALKKHGALLQGCREKELKGLQKNDAVDFFHVQGIHGTHVEIQMVCEVYGFHPLSVRLLTGLIVNDLETPGEIMTVKKFDITNDIIQNKHHVLEQAFNTLATTRQKLLCRIACFRSATQYDAIRALAENRTTLDDDLRDLFSRGLVNRDLSTNLYDLHPIVRRYAYKRLAEKIETHFKLEAYFRRVVDFALPEEFKDLPIEVRYIFTDTHQRLGSVDLHNIIELYHHAVHSRHYEEAITLYRDFLHEPLYFQFGAHQLIIELLSALLEYPQRLLHNRMPHLHNPSARAWVLNELANSYSIIGQPHQAIKLYMSLKEILRKIDDRDNLPISLTNLAQQQIAVGQFEAAEINLRRSIEICTLKKQKLWESIGHRSLGRLFSYEGLWAPAENELTHGSIQNDNIQNMGITWAHRSLRSALMFRANAISLQEESLQKEALREAKLALHLADKVAHKKILLERDFVRAYWTIGVAYFINSQITEAANALHEALARGRTVNTIEFEADILLGLARLSFGYGFSSAATFEDFEQAKSLAEEALSITERCGYVLQGADVNLFLAQYALKQESDKTKAKEYVETALKLAYCDGPPYYYKVAYQEAERLLERLK
jgi:tetratricopeptide (TPR) repeat protein